MSTTQEKPQRQREQQDGSQRQEDRAESDREQHSKQDEEEKTEGKQEEKSKEEEKTEGKQEEKSEEEEKEEKKQGLWKKFAAGLPLIFGLGFCVLFFVWVCTQMAGQTVGGPPLLFGIFGGALLAILVAGAGAWLGRLSTKD